MNGFLSIVCLWKWRFRSSERGMSVGELLVAVAILSTVTAAALPHVGRMARIYSNRAATLAVYAELQEARGLAATTGDRVSIRVNEGDRSYGIYRDRNRDRLFVEDELAATRHVDGDTGALRISGPNLVFTPNGTADPSGTLTLTDPTFGTYRVTVSPAGRVRIE